MDRLLDKYEVAKILKMSHRTIEGWVPKKRIPYIRVGPKNVRFSIKQIQKWLDENTQEAVNRDKKC